MQAQSTATPVARGPAVARWPHGSPRVSGVYIDLNYRSRERLALVLMTSRRLPWTQAVEEVPAMTSPVIELPRITGTCPELLTAAVRRAVHSGGSWQQTADRVVSAL